MIKRILILPEVKRRFEAYITHCKFEISGLGMVEEIGNDLVITEIFLLEQEGSAASTVLDPAALAKFVTELAMSGKDTSKLKWWWHSHVNFGCYWSKTDDTCMDNFKPNDYFIATVGNKNGESKTRLDIYNPLRVSVDDMPLEIYHETSIDAEVIAEVIAEIKEKVSEVVLFAPQYSRKSRTTPPATIPFDDGDFYDPDVDELDFDSDSMFSNCFSEEEFQSLADGMGITFDELLVQENMQLSHGWVF
jgi:hypothetical protein